MTKSDASLIPAAADVKAPAFAGAELESLYADLGPRLLRFIERHVGDPAAAEDLLQEVFVRVIRRPFVRLGEAETRSYLYRVAASLVQERGRRIARARRFAWVWGEPAPVEPRAETGVQEALSRLKDRDRALLLLAYVEEMSHQEIAAVLGVGVASVKVLLSRSRKRFAASLRALGLDPESLP